MASKYDNMPILDENGKLIHRMTPAERAKIFMPFDALKGLQAELRKIEEEVEMNNSSQLSDTPFENLEVTIDLDEREEMDPEQKKRLEAVLKGATICSEFLSQFPNAKIDETPYEELRE